jgi:acetyl-CoA synthetase
VDEGPDADQDVSYQLDDFHIRWYADGELNASVNCLDRHLATRGDKTALIFEQDDPAKPAQHISYRELQARVCRLANALRALGGARRRPRHHLPADDSGSRCRDAGVRAHRRHPLGGVRRFAPQSIADRVHDCQSKLIITCRRRPARRQEDSAQGQRRCRTEAAGHEFGRDRSWSCAIPAPAVDMQMPRDRWYDAWSQVSPMHASRSE